MVARDALDEADFDEVMGGSDTLSGLAEEGARLLPDFRSLLQDVFCALVKLNVVVADAEALPPSARVRLAVVREVTATEGFADTRRVTVLRPTAAGFALLRLGRALIEVLKRGRLLDRQELEALWRLALADGERRELDEQLASAEALREARAEDDAQAAIARARAALLARRRSLESEASELAEQVGRAVEGAPREVWTRLADEVANAGEAVAAIQDQAGAGEGREGGEPRSGDGGGVDALALKAQLAELPGAKRLMRLLGALREEARAAQRKRAPRAQTEVFGVERGADLARLLPAEIVGLRHPVLRRELRRRLLERSLLGYRLKGEDRLGRGPAIFLLDVSGSMAGRKVVWAKAIVLTLADLARRSRRRATVICFSSGARRRRVELATPRRGRPSVELDPSELIALSRVGTGGGTDFEGPLQDAMEIIEGERNYRRADVVLVTDGEAHVSAALRDRIRAFRAANDTRFMGILIDVADHQRESVQAFCDPVLGVSELSLDDARKVFRAF